MKNLFPLNPKIKLPLSKMLEQNYWVFKKKFLLLFTKELIRNTGAGEFFILKKFLDIQENFQGSEKEKEKLIKQELFSPVKYEPTMAEILKKIKVKRFNEKLTNPFVKEFGKPILRIPETHLPPRFQYLKPVASEIQIELGKLNPFINDPAVQTIQCNGANENLIVQGKMGEKPINIKLNEEEIKEVIKKFSEIAKIPVNEGIFKVAIGKLILNLVVSKTLGSRFTIKKIKSQQEIPVPKPFD